MKKNLILIFAKNPVAGRVKTRLAKDVGEKKALQVYQYLLDHSAKVTSRVNASKQVWYADHINEKDIWDNEVFEKKLQSGDHLGERMENAFRSAFAEGYEKVVIVGTDLYDIQPADIDKAFQKLDEFSAVIGPAKDGGYYLLGMNSMITKVFRNKKWSTDSVFRETMTDLQDHNTYQLEMRNDIDILEDIMEIEPLKKIVE